MLEIVTGKFIELTINIQLTMNIQCVLLLMNHLSRYETFDDFHLSTKNLYTPHLNEKKLSTNSSWDFEYVLEPMDDY